MFLKVRKIVGKIGVGISGPIKGFEQYASFFNPAKIQIIFQLPTITKKSLLQIKDVYDNTLTELSLKKGQSKFYWNFQNLALGVYFYQTEIGAHYYKGKIHI